MVPVTATALGVLDTHEADGLHRVISLCLHDDQAKDGDGVYVYWLVPGDTYGFVHDGLTWTVSGGAWVESGHTYRLIRGGHPAMSVPTLHGDEFLDRDHCYVAQHTTDGWELWRVNEPPD